MKASYRLAGGFLILAWPVLVLAQEVALPRRDGSVRFAVLGDTGTGDDEQYEIGTLLAKFREAFPFDFVIMLGDNLYGKERPQDFAKKFERPYKALLDAKVEFHAALGNHDDPNQRFYKPFNLGGERYRTFKKGNVRFFVLDSNYLDPDQVKWLAKELEASGSDWKIPYFHHPLYTTGKRGPEVELRAVLESLFVKSGVDVVFNGHQHVYERIRPQKGIHYFVAGGSAKLFRGDVRPGEMAEVGYASDRSFMLVEIDKNEMFFQAISRSGKTIDKGVIKRREVADTAAGSSDSARPRAKRPARPKARDSG